MSEQSLVTPAKECTHGSRSQTDDTRDRDRHSGAHHAVAAARGVISSSRQMGGGRRSSSLWNSIQSALFHTHNDNSQSLFGARDTHNLRTIDTHMFYILP